MRVIPPVPITSQGSFTRSTTGTCYNSIGLVTTVGVNLPRFNYDPVNLTLAPTLLIESATTNLCTYSEAFDNAAWTKNLITITANNTTAPDGTLTADKVISTTGTGYHQVYQTIGTSILSGVSYTFSVYVKPAGYNYIYVQLVGTPYPGNPYVEFNLSNGTVTYNSNITSYTIVSVGSGWYRLSVSKPSNTAGTVSCYLALGATQGVSNFTGDGASGVFVWGAQFEQTTAPTSYIPTVASTVLRAADSFSGTGLVYSNIAESSVNMLSRTEDLADSTYWTLDSCTVASNVVNDPINNYLSADSVTKTGAKTGFAHLRQQVVIGTNQNAGRTYTASIWLWCASGTKSAAIVISDVDYATYTGSTITITTTPTRYSFSSNGGGSWNASGNKIAMGLDLTAAATNDTIYCFGPQLEVSGSATTYVSSYTYEVPWVSSVTYPQGTIVSRNTNHRIYTKLTSAAGSSTAPESDSVNWFDSGPNNRWALFATDRNIASYNHNSIQLLISPGERIDSIGLLGLDLSSASIKVYTADGLQYTHEELLNERETISWSDYFFGGTSSGRPTVIRFNLPTMLGTLVCITLAKTTATAKCSAVVLGTNVYLGSVQMNPKSEVLNFSKIERDAYGNSTLVPRRSVPKTTQELFLPSVYINKVRAVRTALNATPALWSGLDDATTDTYYEALLILGIYKEFTIDLENQINSRVNLQLEEI